ncbi:NnrU family protein [Shewanella sp. D64]|uniref:NnrU family protein n=1 Tax=unclassified Shewanella TaxID=196818 RepID=UPI0022BA12EF|nr:MULTISPECIES: NnrU family protein [unclassified Shewanella]MEC4723945.1 NnrU family protein [Shewanella sp. D64]MEC4735965.1 NnrU family protein [Shewanella sp. E94]WBJ93070.1 NnrU family protein [Shewanella sp. MTB7]
MGMLISGLILWSLVHFIPSAMPNLKQAWLAKIGLKGYTITFSLLIVLSLCLMVFGWRASIPELIYTLPLATKPLALILMLMAFILFAAKQKTRIKRVIRHPQLVSVLVWSIAHLILNGDSRSIVLFGGMLVWSVLQIYFINRSEGAWLKPRPTSWRNDIKVIIIGGVIFSVLLILHPYLSGVSIV